MAILYKKIPGRDVLPKSWNYEPPTGFEVFEARTFEDLARHAEAWDKLFFRVNTSPFTSYPWVKAFFTHSIEEHESWICLFAYQEGELIGVLPLIVRRAYRVAGFSFILFRTPYELLHTGINDFLMPPDNQIALDLFFNYLSKIPASWPIVSLKSLSEHSPIVVNRDQHKVCFVLTPTTLSNYIELPKSYDDYHASLPSNLQKIIKRNTKKLEQLKDAKFILRDDQRSTRDNMNHFMDAEHSGWKEKTGSSIKSQIKHAEALLMAAEELEKRGWMEWNFIEADNRTIAAHYSVRVNRTVYVVKIGFLEEYKACSPGSLLFNKVIENSFLNGDVDEINTLGDYTWQYQWQVKGRQLYDCLLLPRIPVVCCIIKLIFLAMRKKQIPARNE